MTRKWNWGTPEEKHQKIVNDYRNGMSVADITNKFGYASASAVRYILKKNGVMAQAPGRWGDKPIDVPKVLALQAAGWSIEKIVEEFDHKYTAKQIRKAVKDFKKKGEA